MLSILFLMKNQRILFTAAVAIPLMLVVTGVALQSASAQTPASNFSVKGYTGQQLVLPPGLSQHVNPSTPGAPPTGSVISGNWSFAVSNGQLKDFKWHEVAMTLSGKQNGTLAIDKLTNASGSVRPNEPATIVLHGNSTAFKGNVDIVINGKPMFTNVPVAVHLLNGKLVNFTISPAKTNDLFPLPLFGIVTSLTH
jgi:hypothetical protein